MPDEESVLLKTEHLELSLRRASSQSTNGLSVQFSKDNDATVKLPNTLDVGALGGSKTVDIVVNHLLFSVNLLLSLFSINRLCISIPVV